MQPRPQRKACDVCYHKRIKCDGQKPRCSHCILYHSACTFEASRRRVQDGKRKLNTEVEGLQARVETLQASLSQAVQRISELEGKGETVDTTPDASPASTNQEDHVRQEDRRAGNAPLELPPRHEVLSAVQRYLATFNSAIPLFDPDRLLRSVNGWYTSADQRDCTTWAAINVVLALAHRQTLSGNTYIENAQSVLAQVVMEDTKLLSVQFLVGMVLLFQGVQDLKPATMLIAIALRLAHELGLHAQHALGHAESDSSLTLEKSRVFWIAYILDRDISMRTKRPPIQREMDIGLEWPSTDPPDGAGSVVAADGVSGFNFFLARVQLAQIQGEIYDAIHSARAQGASSHQQLDKAVELHERLDDWMSRVPWQFRPDSLLHAGDTPWCRSFGVLFSSHLACRIDVCRVHVMETQWLQTLREFGRDAARDGAVASAPSPLGWHELVDESRQYMRLFTSIEQKDPAFVWMTACTYISAGVCLIANNMFHPLHANVAYDEGLANTSLSFLADMVQQVPYEPLKRTHESCQELLRQAHVVRLGTSSQFVYL